MWGLMCQEILSEANTSIQTESVQHREKLTEWSERVDSTVIASAGQGASFNGASLAPLEDASTHPHHCRETSRSVLHCKRSPLVRMGKGRSCKYSPSPHHGNCVAHQHSLIGL